MVSELIRVICVAAKVSLIICRSRLSFSNLLQQRHSSRFDHTFHSIANSNPACFRFPIAAQSKIEMKMWYLLVDKTTGAPFNGVSASKVDVSDTADVDDLRYTLTLSLIFY